MTTSHEPSQPTRPDPVEPAVVDQLRQLVIDGAELVLHEPDGQTSRWPLARHLRYDATDGRDLVWLRPLTATPTPSDAAAATFHHGDARRRMVAWTSAVADGDVVHLITPTGQHLQVRPIAADLTGLLDRWDRFMWSLPAELELALDDLHDDSW